MRKIIIALFIAIPCFMTSCIKEEDVHIHNYGIVKTFYIDVYSNHWVDRNDLPYIYASFSAPEITKEVIENGIVVAYFIDADGRDNMLPYLLPYYDDNIGDYYYENVRFDVSRGKITFIIEDSDFNHANIPSHMSFKVATAL
ncbi:MAG: hypothetical protein IKY79_06525 [Bacteroidales bacterium]|nr:hypothetical protein [Bacteroidales bacterium]